METATGFRKMVVLNAGFPDSYPESLKMTLTRSLPEANSGFLFSQK